MKKIYIASPYTQGDKEEMVRLQIDAWHILRDLGYIPIAPLLTHFINLVRERSHGEWLTYDFEILGICQVLIRIRPKVNGVEIPSSGADMEVAEANRLGLIVLEFETLEEMKSYLEDFPL